MTPPRNSVDLLADFASIGDALLARDTGTAVMEALTQLAVQRVDGADYAGVTVGRAGASFKTVAATDDHVRTIDAIQYELGSGPCVDAVLAQTIYNSADLRSDQRWPEFGRLAVERTGIVSMLSSRFYVEADGAVIAALNLYSHRVGAFDQRSEATIHLLATHGALAVAKVTAEEKSRNLMRALETSREIGTAMGILMAREKITREQAFDLLRIASQRTHRKLAAIAAEVADTGALPDAAQAPITPARPPEISP